jgi:hypothetical protein
MWVMPLFFSATLLTEVDVITNNLLLEISPDPTTMVMSKIMMMMTMGKRFQLKGSVTPFSLVVSVYECQSVKLSPQ